MFEILDMKLSFTEEDLKQLCLEVLPVHPTKLACPAQPKPSYTSPRLKNSRSRSPDMADSRKRRRAKFIVEEDESDNESEFELDGSYYKSELEDSYIYPSPPQLSRSVSSSSATSSVITPPEESSSKLVRSRAAMDLYAGFNSRQSCYSPRTLFSPTIEVPMVDAHATVGNFTKSSATGWRFSQWLRSSPWTAAKRSW